MASWETSGWERQRAATSPARARLGFVVRASVAGVAIIAGGLGMPLSFLYLASPQSMADITAGTSGFMAGAVLIGAGLVSLAILSTNGPDICRKQSSTFSGQSSTDITA